MYRSAFLILTLVISTHLQAATLVYNLTGVFFEIDETVTSIDYTDTWSATFSISYDAPVDNSDPERVKYYGVEGEIYINDQKLLEINNNTYVGYGFDNANSGSPDYFEIVGDNPSNTDWYLDGQLITGFGTGIRDSYLADTSLPGTLQLNDLEDGSWGSGLYVYTNNNNNYSSGDFLFRGFVETVDVQVVPVPAAAWLFGSALVGLVGVKRKN